MISFPELKLIKELRISLGLTQRELAKISNVSQSYITKIEKGLLEPSYTLAVKIFKTLFSLLKRDNNVKAEDIMNKNLIYCNANDCISEVIEIMQKYNISQLPVFENSSLPIGYVSENIILKYISTLKPNCEIKNIIEPCVPIISHNSNIDIIIFLLNYYPFLLVNKDGSIKGIITKSDVLKYFKEKR